MKRRRSDHAADAAADYVFWKDPGFFGCLITGLLCAVVLVKLFSSEDGMLKVREVKHIKAQLEEDIAQLEQANASLIVAIDLMRTDPFRQEKIVREELNMALPGEIIYRFAE